MTYSTSPHIGTLEHQLLRHGLRLRRPGQSRSASRTPTGRSPTRSTTAWTGPPPSTSAPNDSATRRPALVAGQRPAGIEHGPGRAGPVRRQRSRRRQPDPDDAVRRLRPSDNRVTQYFYDWRDRLVATKSGVQSSEDTTTHRPIIYYDLDNLGEVTATSHYDGDGVTLTSTKPQCLAAARATRSTATTTRGASYQTQVYDVNQSTGAVSIHGLTTNLYYDHRGDLIAESDPGGLWTKDQYDGAAAIDRPSYRPTAAAARPGRRPASSTGDHVLKQTLTTYDADGNPILVADKERFNTRHGRADRPAGQRHHEPAGPRLLHDVLLRRRRSPDRRRSTSAPTAATAYTRPGSVPAGSDTALVTSYTYNAGRLGAVRPPTRAASSRRPATMLWAA